MCGIAGIVRLGERPLPPPGVMGRMLSAIEYRGPDGSGEFRNDHVHLGAVRLAIIDLKGGQQPVHGCDERVVSVYNGEVYNYQELRTRLRRHGHDLQDECDTTVLPHLYEQHGDSLVDHLRGMYAFAIWDDRERRLLLARDRLGIKPLYFAVTSDYVVFGSEIKAILASGLVEAQLDRDSIDDLFSLSYPCPPRTMFRGVQELRPAHLARVQAGRGMEAPRRYWRVPFRHRGEYRRGRRRDLDAELREMLEHKIYEHLQSDVRVATYLSGGLDSSSISALVKRVTGDAPTTFTVGFPSAEHDERDFAGAMAAALGSKNHQVVCDETSACLYPRTIWHTELPLQYPLALPLMQLSGLASSQGFKVILTGEGADELMGGYDCFRAQKMRRLLDRPGVRSLRRLVYGKLYKWHGMPEGTVDAMLRIQERTIGDVATEFSGVYPAWYDNWQVLDVDRDLLLGGAGRCVRPTSSAPAEFTGLVPEDVAELDPLDAQLAVEIESRLASWILLIGDRASMAEGVEARVPLLDHELVEFVASMPPQLKMKGFVEKSFLRGAMKGVLPESVRKRQKRPFYTPVKHWFFSNTAPDYVAELLSDRALRDAGLFAPEIVKKLRHELDLVPETHLRRHQLEWVLIQVLGTQLLHRLFVADFEPFGMGELSGAGPRTV